MKFQTPKLLRYNKVNKSSTYTSIDNVARFFNISIMDIVDNLIPEFVPLYYLQEPK